MRSSPAIPASRQACRRLFDALFPAIGVLLAILAMPFAAGAPFRVAEPENLPLVDSRELRFNRLPGSQGLSQTRVAHIAQDERGFMWLGTQYGLNRYDGYAFKVFVHDPQRPESLGGVYVSALFLDRDGVLWVGCGPVLDRYDADTESFTHFPLEAVGRNPGLVVSHISQDEAGLLWLSTNDGLRRFDPRTGESVRYARDPDDASSLGDNDIKSSGLDRAGAFWVGHSSGLDRFDRRTGRVDLHLPLGESGHGLLFHEDRFGTFWVIHGAEGRLAVFDRATRTMTARVPAREAGAHAAPVSFAAMLEDRDGVMWFATYADGLLKFDREKNGFVRFKNYPGDLTSPAGDRLTTLYQDHEGSLWAGYHQTVPQVFSPYPPLFADLSKALGASPGSELGLVSTIYEDREKILWVGAATTLRRLDRVSGRSTVFEPTSGVDVLAVLEHGAGTLWFGTAGRGLIRYDRRTGDVKTYRRESDNPASLSSDHVQRLFVARDGTFWVATWNGLNRFDPDTGTFTVHKPDPLSRGLNYYAITEAADGTLWLGSSLGLHRFDPRTGNFTVYKNDEQSRRSLSDNRVNSVCIDHAGVLWAGTQNGLNRFDPATGTFRVFTTREGLAGNVVSAILEDEAQALWMSTNNGVSRLDATRARFRNYTVADGLPGPDLTGWGAAARSSSGGMVFGGFSGATAFFPSQADRDSAAPRIALTDFRLFERHVRPGEGTPLRRSITTSPSLNLGYDRNFFSFEFSALSYVDAADMRYRYKLEGIDPDWVRTGGDQRRAIYTALPPGRYVFRAEAASPRGVWRTPGLALPVVISPPWWETRLFRVGVALVLLGVLLVMYRTRIGELQRRQREFRRLADNAPDLVMRFDARLRLVYVNPVVGSHTGLTEAELLGKTIEEIDVGGPRLPVDRGELAEVLIAARRSCKEFTCETPQGVRYFESRLIPELNGQGVPRSVLAITRDITEPKRAQEELRQSEARLTNARLELAHATRVTTMGQLTASVAHEVSQPLAGIVTNAKACLRWLAAAVPNLDEARQATQRIIRDSDRASEVVQRIRTLFRKADHFLAPVAINEEINEVVALIRNEIEKHQIELHLELAPDLPTVLGDRVQLQQVLLNLMLNGIEAMHRVQGRARRLRIGTITTGADVRVAVRDAGVGLGAEGLARIFDAFYTTKPNGMGMGLSISRSIVEAHHGRLWVMPNEGAGVTFWFSLPTFLPAPPPAAATSSGA